MGFSDAYIAELWNTTEDEVYGWRVRENIFPVYKMIDTCASEFDSYVPYFYSTYAEENESVVTDRRKVIILGSGPIRMMTPSGCSRWTMFITSSAVSGSKYSLSAVV